MPSGTLTLPLVSATWEPWTRTTRSPLPLATQALHEVSRLGRLQRLHHQDSYRPHSRAGHCFRTFHMFVDELCLQLVGDYRTAVHRSKARAQQSDLLRLQGVGQHHPERSGVTITLKFSFGIEPSPE